MTDVDHTIHGLARLGVLERSRLIEAGISDRSIASRLAGGSLRQMHPGVYTTFGHSLPYESEVYAGCLAAGPEAVASHRSALAIWDLIDGPQPIEVTAPRSSHPIPAGIVVHRPNILRPIDVVEVRQLPVTNPLRTLLDAGAVLPRGVVGDCVERALVRQLVSVAGLRRILADLGGRGRSGTGALRAHLDRRALGDKRPESVIEPLMARLLYDDHGIGPIEYQPTLVLEGKKVRPDFLVSRALTAVEVDGLDAHATREALQHDLARQNLLVRNGYQVLRYTITDLRRPARTAREIVAACLRRIDELARLAAA